MKQLIPGLLKGLKSWLLLASIFFAFQPLHAQDNKGTEFWICIPGNNAAGFSQLYLTSDVTTTATITGSGFGFSATVTIPAGGLQVVELPPDAQIESQFVVENKGIHITSGSEITVYAMNAQTATTDAYLAFPVDAIGTSYYVLAYFRDFSFSIPTQATILATQNNTTVTITSSLTDGGFTAGVPQNIVLQQGQIYQLRSLITNADYTGTKITSDKPISVFGGAQCTNISGILRACDHLVEQMPPLTSWGKSFVTVPLATRLAGDVFRFLAQNNGTQVSVNGVPVASLNAGQYFETILGSSTYNRITSNEPILVGQYSRSSDADGVTSDPFFSLVPPDEQFLNSYIISAGTSNIPINYLNITSPSTNTGTVTVDGVVVNPALWVVIPGSSFSGAKVQVGNGVHRVNSALPIGLLVYGFGSFDSYGYLGGQSFSPVATVTSIDLTPPTGTGPAGSNQCWDALVRDQFGVPVVGVRVDFNVTGVNPNASFSNTNASGIAHFCYTGMNAGTDNIVASIGGLSDNSSFIWTPSATNVYYSKAAGDLHNVLTWGVNPDGSGANPPDFGTGKTFMLANRPGVYTMTGDWAVDGTLNDPALSQLQINNFTLSIADLTGGGTLSGSTLSNLIVTGASAGDAGTLNFTPGANMLNNLTVDRSGVLGTATIGSPLDLLNVLTVNNGTLVSGGMLTLKSTAANTARVAPIPGTGNVSGNVIVERYVPARRAWRIMSAPTGGPQTIQQSWQEGAAPNTNPHPGYGTHITGGPVFGSPANGFDQNPGAASSLKTYSGTAWMEIPNTNANPVGTRSLMLFVRGDRGIPIGLNTVPPNNTTLRTSGPLNIGDKMFPVPPSGFAAIPNPFASPINFATITRSNVNNNFYLWDPKMGGVNGVGAYVNLSFNGVGYDIVPASVSPESQYIQSGQGFLVASSGVPGSLTIKESDKSATPATDVFRTMASRKGFRITLESIEPDNTLAVLDETYASYSSSYSLSIDAFDAPKPDNMHENLGMVINGQTLMVERRPVVTDKESIALKLWNTSPEQNYAFEFSPESMSSTGLYAYLEDKYLGTSTPIDMDRVSRIYFTANGDPASSNPYRFRIIFTSERTKPVVTEGLIRLYPNPVVNGTVRIEFTNLPKGTYEVRVLNQLGQVILTKAIYHPGGTGTISQKLVLDRKLSKGVYDLQVSGAASRSSVKLVSY